MSVLIDPSPLAWRDRFRDGCDPILILELKLNFRALTQEMTLKVITYWWRRTLATIIALRAHKALYHWSLTRPIPQTWRTRTDNDRLHPTHQHQTKMMIPILTTPTRRHHRPVILTTTTVPRSLFYPAMIPVKSWHNFSTPCHTILRNTRHPLLR